jgi:hypothetical protein
LGPRWPEAQEETLELRVTFVDVQQRGARRWVDAEIELRSLDGAFDTVFSERLEVLSNDPAPGQLRVQGRFQDSRLWDQLQSRLPPPAVEGAWDDPFWLSLLHDPETGWQLELGSLRPGPCRLFGTTPPPAERGDCAPYEDSLRPLANRELVEADLDVEVADGVTPRSALAVMEALDELNARFTSTEPPVRLSVGVAPQGFSCISRGSIPEWSDPHRDEPADYPAGEPAVDMVIPVTFELQTDGDRLSVEVPGQLVVRVSPGDPWNGDVECSSGYTSAQRLLDDGHRLGLEIPEGKLGFFHFQFIVRDGVEVRDNLYLHPWAPYAGVPPYPDLTDPGAHRAYCFGVPEAGRFISISAP